MRHRTRPILHRPILRHRSLRWPPAAHRPSRRRRGAPRRWSSCQQSPSAGGRRRSWQRTAPKAGWSPTASEGATESPTEAMSAVNTDCRRQPRHQPHEHAWLHVALSRLTPPASRARRLTHTGARAHRGRLRREATPSSPSPQCHALCAAGRRPLSYEPSDSTSHVPRAARPAPRERPRVLWPCVASNHYLWNTHIASQITRLCRAQGRPPFSHIVIVSGVHAHRSTVRIRRHARCSTDGQSHSCDLCTLSTDSRL